MAVIPTQTNVLKYLKEWEDAEDMKTAVEAADKCAKEYDGLYEESARNLLARTPNLMLLLSSYLAGRSIGREEEAAKHKPVQEAMV